MRQRRRLTPVVLALSAALSVAACSVSSSDDSAATTAAADTTAATTAETMPVELARGVTADTIKIGGAMIDIEKLKSFGVDLGEAAPELIPALVDWINETPINGRTIDYVERTFLPIGTETSEQACRELIEDEEVFAVAGVFLDASPLCVTETYATAYFGGFGLTPEFQARSKAPFITTGSDYQEELDAATKLLIEKDLLAGAKVGVYSETDSMTKISDEVVVQQLKDAGIDVVSSAQLADTGGDQVAAAADIARILQKFEADGVDTLVSVTGLNVLLPALEQTEYAPQIVIINGQILGSRAAEGFGLTNPAELKGAIGVTSGLSSEEVAADPIVQECIAGINAHSSLAITTTDLLPKTENPASRGFSTVPILCGIFDLMRKVLIAAGPNPTNESIIAGLDTIGPITVAGSSTGSLSSTRWGVGGETRIFNFDEAAVTFFPEQ